jgi:hypothetical protein
MAESPGDVPDLLGIPASLQRRNKEPTKSIQLRIPLSWSEELNALAREFDQNVSTFLREATEDWLRRARKVHEKDTPRIES